jgi:hypothetical protein
MCAMTVGLLLLLAAVSMAYAVGDGYRKSSDVVSTAREARAALGSLSSDFARYCHYGDGVVDDSMAKWPCDRLGFLCLQAAYAQSESGRIGDLCGVHYYVEDREIGGKTVRCLMRGFRESRETFAALKQENVPALFRMDEKRDEPIAFGVVAFDASLKSRRSDGKWADWKKHAADSPGSLEVRLVFARPELAAKLKTRGDWEGKGRMARWLGDPLKASQNEKLEVYEARIQVGPSRY